MIDVDVGKDDNRYIHGFYLVMLKKPKSFCQSKDFEISIDGDNDENSSQSISELMYDSSSIPLNINLIEIENSLLIDSMIVLCNNFHNFDCSYTIDKNSNNWKSCGA